MKIKVEVEVEVGILMEVKGEVGRSRGRGRYRRCGAVQVEVPTASRGCSNRGGMDGTLNCNHGLSKLPKDDHDGSTIFKSVLFA